jgi:hypothetical protein
MSESTIRAEIEREPSHYSREHYSREGPSSSFREPSRDARDGASALSFSRSYSLDSVQSYQTHCILRIPSLAGAEGLTGDALLEVDEAGTDGEEYDEEQLQPRRLHPAPPPRGVMAHGNVSSPLVSRPVTSPGSTPRPAS